MYFNILATIDNSPPKSLLLSTKGIFVLCSINLMFNFTHYKYLYPFFMCLIVRERMLRESMMRKLAAPKISARGPTQEQSLDATGDGPPFGTLNRSTGVRPTTSNVSMRVFF